MKPSDITFSVNQYDKDGEVIDEGIFLYFGDTSIKVASNFEEFKTILWQMQKIVNEIEENEQT